MQVRQRTVPVTAMALAQGADALPYPAGRSQSSTNPSQPPADPLQSLTSSPSPGGRLQTSGSGSPRPSSYFSAVYTPPSLEISSQSSEAGRWSGDTEMHGAEQSILDHDQAEPNHSRNEVEDIEVMDIDNTPSSRALDNFGGWNPKAIPRLAANGLIKTPTALPHLRIVPHESDIPPRESSETGAFDVAYAASQQSRQTIRRKECDKNAIGLVPISNFCVTPPSCDVLRSFCKLCIFVTRTDFRVDIVFQT
ncbi:hypothetical protein K469DRAFT_29166 [Zopfia rhizophila CBS 207.26]|uniref:Uncharacterized protein n=1 Tax=Zopfia rhizophila CBS 207.26 TaxID=1314779 RepID=A0A6A6DA19_9PEZI|nr:hypothetical protein K469DRAFT_29166 [Zopfia rhizophila CBS 207.26]